MSFSFYSYYGTFTCHVFINDFIQPMFIKINDVPLIRGTFLNSIVDQRISQIKILRVISSKQKISVTQPRAKIQPMK